MTRENKHLPSDPSLRSNLIGLSMALLDGPRGGRTLVDDSRRYTVLCL